jgi:hypothetical protein
VLNLVRPEDRRQLFAEVLRVLKPHGRAAISDIVADRDVPGHLQRDPRLWSGCIAGAFREDQFVKAFEAVGFHGMEIVKREQEPWQTVEGIEFRAMTVVAHKGVQGPGLERRRDVIYRGPFKKVEDDAGNVYQRGERTAVPDVTFDRLRREPYQAQFAMVVKTETSDGQHPARERSTSTTNHADACCEGGACC